MLSAKYFYWLIFLILATPAMAAPKVEALVPGMSIERLPVALTNINSIVYGHDGRLYAAAYNGRIYVLTDTDGDGIEDNAHVFWDKPGDLLTPVGIAAAEEGLYLAVRGKIALLRDTDGDGVADESEAVVSGWIKETHNNDRRNDASGITLDDDGNLYFSLGCMSYNKAWMLGKNGQSNYRKDDERGTILKVSADRKKREIFATGLRFAIGLEFNKHGDLFATDQEGDTWFPGGNPRDELLHISPGKHYGFPFRHGKYLPDSIDEPETVGFAPQHQSTCGFRFNEVKPNRMPFGPAHWEGDALVTGFSRGKLWRVPLAKSRAGYVGRQVQIAAFESLPTDVAISPGGDLLVTCHGGSPDWGSGPAAKGHLYKIRFDSRAPQPVAAWSSGPFETKVAFDKPIDPKRLSLPGIQMGKHVWEGNQQEWILPGYEVVKAEKRALRRPLKVNNVSVSKDCRTATFTTAPHPWRARYGIVLPDVVARDAESRDSLSTIELSYDLSGVYAEWTRKGDSNASWKGWLPHLDLNIVRALTRGSAEHEELYKLLNEPGQLSIRSRLLLPGTKVSFRFEGNSDFRIQCGGTKYKTKATSGTRSLEFSLASREQEISQEKPRGDREEVLPTEEIRIEIELQTGVPNLSFDASYQADFDPYDRPLRLEHLFVPWAPSILPPESEAIEDWSNAPIPGDPEKGREIFFSTEVNCALCHSFDGKGGETGPSLTVSAHRGPEAVLRDIVDPGASINPEYVSYSVTTRDEKTIVGLFLSADEKEITLIDVASQSHTIQRDNISDISALPISLMPLGFANLGKDKLQDLVAFLCSGQKKEGSPAGGILREYWLDLPEGNGISALTNYKDFPTKPTGKHILNKFEGPVNWKEYYGSRIRGYLLPPQTGDYTFWMAADDYAELWLSTSDDPKKKERIIKLTKWTPSRDWTRYPEHKSKPVRLEGGKRYYIETLQVEGRVDDCIAVGWQLPGGKTERPIPGMRLSPYQNNPD